MDRTAATAVHAARPPPPPPLCRPAASGRTRAVPAPSCCVLRCAVLSSDGSDGSVPRCNRRAPTVWQEMPEQ